MDNCDAPATKADLAALEARLEQRTKADLASLEERIQADLAQVKDQLLETILEKVSDSETRLLTAFYSFTRSNEQRQSQLEGNEIAHRVRLATHDSRITEIERRLNIPKPDQS